MGRKLIVVDLDGTLLTNFKKIPELNKKALIEAQNRGHIVMISTGRLFNRTVDYAKELEIDKHEGLVSTSHGSLVTNIITGEKIVDLQFGDKLLRDLTDIITSLKMGYTFIENDIVYVNNYSCFFVKIYRRLNGQKIVKNYSLPRDKAYSVNKIILINSKKKLFNAKNILEKKFHDFIDISFSSFASMEITPKNGNKGNSVLRVAELYNIPKKDILVFGNTGNDESMFKIGATSVAVSNATKELKSLADYITLSNNKAGVGDYIKKFILKD